MFWFLNSILKLSSELALVITLLGGPFLSLYPMGAVAILLDKFRKKRMARITDPEEKPFIIGKETIEKVINQSDPQLLNDARIIEWKKLYGLK